MNGFYDRVEPFAPPDRFTLTSPEPPKIGRVLDLPHAVEMSWRGSWIVGGQAVHGVLCVRMTEEELHRLTDDTLPNAVAEYFESRQPKAVIMAALEAHNTEDSSLDDMANAVIAALSGHDLLKEDG